MIQEIQDEIDGVLTGRYMYLEDVTSAEIAAVRIYKKEEEMLISKKYLIRGTFVPLSFLAPIDLFTQYQKLVQSAHRVPFRDEWIELFKQQLLK